jgi:hypothetical protein
MERAITPAITIIYSFEGKADSLIWEMRKSVSFNINPMFNSLRRISFLVLLALLCSFAFGKGVKTKKEKVTIKVNIPPLFELAPKEATYKFLYPKVLAFYSESNFNRYGSGFNNADGKVFSLSKTLLAKKILGNVPTDYTFELETKGITYLDTVGKFYRSSNFGGGYVQKYRYSFPCVLKIYKKDQVVKEFVLDDGSIQYEAMLFKNQTSAPETEQFKYVGYGDTVSIKKSLKRDSEEFNKFAFLTEYVRYESFFKQASEVILSMVGNYDLKTFIPVEFVGEDDAPNYADLNAQCTELFNALSTIKTFDDITSKQDFYKKSAEYFDTYSRKDSIDKRVKILCLRNLATDLVMSGECEKAFAGIKNYDKVNSSFFSSLRSTLFDMFNVFSDRNYYQSYTSEAMVQNTSLNEYYDREARAYKAALLAKEMEKDAQKSEAAKAELERLKKKNIPFTSAVVEYTDSTKGYGRCAVSFYVKDENGQVWDGCGALYQAIYNERGDTATFKINKVKSITFPQSPAGSICLEPVKVITSLFGDDTRGFRNKRILLERLEIYKGYTIYNDRSDIDDLHLVLVPNENNSNRRGYVLANIIKEIEYPLWLKKNQEVRAAITAHQVTNDMKGAHALLDIIEKEHLVQN